VTGKILLAIMSCEMYHNRADAQRATWIKEIPTELDYKFFVGRGAAPSDDTVVLDVPDDYKHFTLKVQAMRRWAYERGYDYVCKLDDDVYARPERLLETVPTGHDYVGRLRGPSGQKPAPYNSGFCYWLSRRAIEKLLDAEWDFDTAEDRWTANELLKRGVKAIPDYRHVISSSVRNGLSSKEPPRCDNQIVTACEFGPVEMEKIHREFHQGVAANKKPLRPAGELSRVSVMIKTFLRDGYLFACLRGLEATLPECKIIVVDDGLEHRDKIVRYAELRDLGHVCVWLPYDSGFGEKANEAIKHVNTEFVLIGSDDFDFANPCVRAGVERLQRVLDARPEIGVASGRVNARAYESCLVRQGDAVREERRFYASDSYDDIKFHYCDLTVNYSLIRRAVFDKVRWDGGDVKIGGGEHGAFFLDVKEAGWKTCVVEGAVIYELLPKPGWARPEYKAMRARARTVEGRPCLKRRGINRWIRTDGAEELA
jgi:glycosyltransferase involved in cell wall biosynthesis